MIQEFKQKIAKEIRERTPVELIGKQIGDFPVREQIGYTKKKDANWCDQIFVVMYKDALVQVVSRFSEIIGM